MIDVARFLFVLLVAIGRANAIEPDTVRRIEESVERLFSMWTLPCAEWTKVFAPGAVWYHPKFPAGIAYEQLMDFCTGNQATKPALFRQDGSVRITVSGKCSSTTLYHVMVPYVYGQVQDGNVDSLFINSGYEYIQLTADQNQQFRINEVVEFFNRASQPFVWPENN
jgi:hypothetical protein